MKKSIVYLGIAVLAFSNVASASETSLVFNISITTNYVDATPLGMAISKGEVDIVKKFVEYGADVNEKSNGMTPLMLAARYNNVKIIEFLLSKGASLKTKNENGFTALKFAEMSNAKEAVAFLKEAGKK